MNSSLISHTSMLPLPSEYNAWLVALSILIAIVAAYVALDLSGRVTTTKGPDRTYWLLGGACAMGTGIWSMHFIGMLAFNLPIVVRYDLGTVFLSYLAAILASGIALMVVSHTNVTLGVLLAGSLAMGAGITTMHYTGMAAMRLAATIEYDQWIVALSILIAISVSCVGLRMVFLLRNRAGEIPLQKKIAGAIVIGSAIPSMHYTAMVAASYVPMGTESLAKYELTGLDISVLGGLAITAGTVLILWATSVAAFVHRQQQVLRTSEERTRAIIDSALDAVVAMNAKGIIIDWNIRAAAIFGWSREEAVGQELAATIIPVRYREAHRAGLTQFLKTGEGPVLNQRVEIAALRKDGTEIPVELAIAPIKLGDHYEFSAFIEDISERKRTEKDLTQAKEAAEAANVAKSQFLANMSHEIRTPMNGVLGMAELLLNTPLTDKQRHLANSVHRSGTALLGIINDILDFSKIEAGKLEIEHLEFGLRETVEEAVNLFADSAGKKGLDLTCFLPEEIPDSVIGDPVRLRQVLLNLVGNAVKFTQRGEVTVWFHLLAQNAQTLTLKCEVTDTGIGILPQAQARLFTAFSQADGSTTRRFGGTGLGLAIVKQLVHLMGGELDITSTPGQGSTFWFTVQLGCGTPRDGTQPTSDRFLSGMRILIVDDNPTNRFILDAHLTSWGAEAISADRGTAALELLNQYAHNNTPVDLAILDIHMPGIDGLMLARAIKTNPVTRRVDLLALSSGDSRAHSGKTEQLGFFAWFQKPIRQSTLRDCLRRHRAGSAETSEASSSVVPSPIAPPAISGSVLLVEDNPVNREVATGMLELLGYHVDIAEDGRQALEISSTGSYDILLMDCQMPVMDGFTATASIRDRERQTNAARIPIVALTANAMEGDREHCLAAGMDDYLTKPFTQRQLEDILSRWLNQLGVSSLQASPGSDSAEAAPESSAPTIQAEQIESSGVVDCTAWEPIRKLKRPGHPDPLGMLLARYLEDSRQLVDQLRHAIESNDPATLHAVAHRLKSSSATLGALTVAARCKELEALGRSHRIEDASDRFRQLERDFEAVCSIFQSALKKETSLGT